MKDQTFEIKVGDLLSQVAVDEIEFEHKKTTLIPNLSEDWITGKIRLSWVDDENVLVEIEQLSCELNETCDYCTKEFKRKIEIQWYSSRFTLNKEEINYANDEVLFFIDEKTSTINIEEMIYQADLSFYIVQIVQKITKIYQRTILKNLISIYDENDEISFFINNFKFSTKTWFKKLLVLVIHTKKRKKAESDDYFCSS